MRVCVCVCVCVCVHACVFVRILRVCVCVCELADTHPGVGDLKLPQDVLGHVVLGHGVHHEVLVAGRALRRPVLMALLL